MTPHTGLIRLPSVAWARKRSCWGDWRPYYESLERIPVTEDNSSQWLESVSRLYALSQEAISMAYMDVVTSKRPDAGVRLAAWRGELGASVSAAESRLESRALHLGVRHPADRRIRREWRQRQRAAYPLKVEMELSIAQIANDITVTANGTSRLSWEGQRRPSTQVAEALLDGRRWRRARAWNSLTRGTLRRWQECVPKFSRLLELRQTHARASGFPSTYAHTFALAQRSYSPMDIEHWCKSIQQTAVPALARLREKNRNAAGLKTLSPWDLDYRPSDALLPTYTEAELLNATDVILRRIHPILSDTYSALRKSGLVHLLPRTNPRAEDLCYPLPASGLAFCTVVNEGQPVTMLSLCHEATHATHAVLANRSCPISWTQLAPMEISELTAATVELLTLDHLKHVMSPVEAAQVAIHHWEYVITFLVDIAMTEDFQRWCYGPGPIPDASACDAKWDDLSEQYDSSVAWRGATAPTGWRSRTHVLETPGYYIEYGMSLIGAIQIWAKSRRDPVAAIDRVLATMSLGGTVDAKTGYRAMGARLTMDVRSIRHAVSLAEQEMTRLRRSVAHLQA